MGFVFREVYDSAGYFVSLVVAENQAQIVCLVEILCKALQNQHQPEAIGRRRVFVFLLVALDVDADHLHRNLVIRNKGGNVLKYSDSLFKLAAFGVPLAVKQLLAVKFVGLSKRPCSKVIESNLPQRILEVDRFVIRDQ